MLNYIKAGGVTTDATIRAAASAWLRHHNADGSRSALRQPMLLALGLISDEASEVPEDQFKQEDSPPPVRHEEHLLKVRMRGGA